MNIGMVSFRFGGLDGVSLEAINWQKALTRLGHKVKLAAGVFSGGILGQTLPHSDFLDSDIKKITQGVFGPENNYFPKPALVKRILLYEREINKTLLAWIEKEKIKLLVIKNVLSLPLNLPLGRALWRVVNSLKIPTIVRHHDLFWEREHFSNLLSQELIFASLIQETPWVRHLVLNSIAQEEMEKRLGIKARIIPDSFDFAHLPQVKDEFNAQFKTEIGLREDDLIFLQSTRLIQRKGIEASIQLVEKLANPRVVLLFTNSYFKDEGGDYYKHLRRVLKKANVRYKFIAHKIGLLRHQENGSKQFSFWDPYLFADFFCFPSFWEGFGNQLLEAIAFRLPIFVRSYPVLTKDILPRGFKFVVFSEKIGRKTIAGVRRLLEKPELRKNWVDHNFRLASSCYSIEKLTEKLRAVIESF